MSLYCPNKNKKNKKEIKPKKIDKKKRKSKQNIKVQAYYDNYILIFRKS